MLSKRIPVERDLIEELSQISNIASKKRTKLHSNNTVQWLRKRFNQTANINYLHFPEELQKEFEVQSVFRNFDVDSSGKLSLGEFHKMLKEAHIDIELDDLKQFYEKVDTNHDVALDFKEFKNCTLSEQANFHFSEMVNKSLDKAKSQERENINKSPVTQFQKAPKKVDLQEDDARQNHFLPRTFGNLMNYITYSSKKSELKKVVSNDSIPINQKFEGFRKLFDLKIGRDVYMQHLSTKFDPSHIQQLRRNLSIGSPKGFGIDDSSFMGASSIGWDKSTISRLPVINQTEFEVEHLKEELNQLVKKAHHDAKKEMYKKERRRPHLIRLANVAERSVSVEPPDQLPSTLTNAASVSPKAFKHPIKPVGSYKDLGSIRSLGRDSMIINNNTDKSKLGSEFEIKDTAKTNDKLEILMIDTEESEVDRNRSTPHKVLSRRFIGQRKIKPLYSPSNKQTLRTEHSQETYETLETRPSDRVVTLSEMPMKEYGKIVESSKPEFSPVDVSKMTWTEVDDVLQKNQSIAGARKPQVRLHMNSYSTSYSKLPKEYLNVSPVYGKQEKGKGKVKHVEKKKLKTILQDGPRVKKQSLGILEFTHAFQP